MVKSFANSPKPIPARRGRRACDRRGQALVEFSLIALVLYLLLAAVIEFGRMLLSAQTIQSAADVAAREIARTPLPATISFEEALASPSAGAVYSDDYLAIDITDQPADQTLLDYLDTLGVPPVNRLLVPVMVVSRVGDRVILRYPGALVTSSSAFSGYTVKIPVVVARGAQGAESIRWVNVVEEFRANDEAPPNDPFNVMSPKRGLVQLRINYPFQAATMTAFQPVANGSGQGNLNMPIIADDGSVVEINAIPGGGSLVAPDSPGPGIYGGPYGGQYGLGELGALNSPQLANGFPLRPFRRVLSAQAVARREVFGN